MLLALGMAGLHASAQSSGALWLNPGFYSVHFDRSADLNNVNQGLGAEYQVNGDWSLTAGRFLNSERAWSNYVGAYYQPWRFGNARIGAALGAFDGYPRAANGGWFPAAISAATWEFHGLGINVLLVPPIKDRLYGALSFQLKFKMN